MISKERFSSHLSILRNLNGRNRLALVPVLLNLLEVVRGEWALLESPAEHVRRVTELPGQGLRVPVSLGPPLSESVAPCPGPLPRLLRHHLLVTTLQSVLILNQLRNLIVYDLKH